MIPCRKCNKKADAESFILSSVDRMMICPTCDRDGKKIKVEEKKEAQPQRPKGWDHEDDYLLIQARKKSIEKPQAAQIGDSNRYKMSCESCKYRFNYDRERRSPNFCPYCAAKVRHF